MRLISTLMFAGAAAIAVVGAATAAEVAQTHVLNVALPDGSVEQIRYVGDTPPQVSIAPAIPAAFMAFSGSPFAQLDAISAEMDREAAAMMQQAQGYQTVSTAPGGASFCSRSVEITSTGNGAPQVVTHTSGNCGAAASDAPAPAVTAPQPKAAPVAPQRTSYPEQVASLGAAG